MTTETQELIRGNVKAAMKDAGASSADLWNVPYSQLRVLPGFNKRQRNAEYEAHIEYLTNSILQNGYYQDKPIAGFVATEDGVNVIYVTEGHSRYEAAGRAIERGAALEAIPVVVKPKGTTMEDLTFALVTSNEGRPFTPFETGLAIKDLVNMGVAEKRIAERLGLTVAYVNSLLELVGAPRAVREMVSSGKVSATVAIKALKQDGSKAAERLKAGLAEAKKAGKEKVTAKHMTPKKPVPVKFEATIDKAGANWITNWITCSFAAEQSLKKGDKVLITIVSTEDTSL